MGSVRNGVEGKHLVLAGAKGKHLVLEGAKGKHLVLAGAKGKHLVRAGAKGEHLVLVQKAMLDHLVCPISFSLPIDPVMAEDGHLYERALIEKHLKVRTRSPITNMPMSTNLVEARHVVNILHAMVEDGMEDPLLDEWAKEHARVKIESVEKPLRTEPPHADPGAMDVYEDGKRVRTEYSSPHLFNGRVDFYEDGKLVRTEYSSPHLFHGQVDVYEDGKHVHTEFSSSHAEHGSIDFYEEGKRVRTEYSSPHLFHDDVDFYEDGKRVRTEFKPPHPNHGLVQFIEDEKLVRTEVHGTVHFFENGKHVCSKFPCGEVRFFKNGRIVRKTFGRKRGRDEC